MKIVFAPDKFKGTLSAKEVCDILQSAFHSIMPDAELISYPMADGGEGFTSAVYDICGGQYYHVDVHAVNMKKITADYLILPDGKTAVMDIASASGLIPWTKADSAQITATSFGTGELIADALSHRVSTMVIGLGGSGCTDAGTGMAQALGFDFYDSSAKKLSPGQTDLRDITSISKSNISNELQQIAFIAAVDVDNPLTGPNGTAHIYAPQKGASQSTVDILECGMNNLKNTWNHEGFWNTHEEPGFGAAGGLGAAMKIYLNASITSGADYLLHLNHFREQVADADYVITGEGCTDSQTHFGKTCTQVAQAAHEKHVPALLLSGSITAEETFLSSQFDACFSAVHALQSESSIISSARENLFFAATQLAKIINMGKRTS